MNKRCHLNMNKGINWQGAVATEDRKHCGLLCPGHADGADSSTQGLFPFCLLQPLWPMYTIPQHSTTTVRVNRMTSWLEGNNGKLANGRMGACAQFDFFPCLQYSGTSTKDILPDSWDHHLLSFSNSANAQYHRNVLYWPDCHSRSFPNPSS